MKLLTLTTDYGLNDYYLPLFKGKLLNQVPDVQIVDISHETKPHFLQTAAFNLRHVWKEFPEKTLHVLRVGESMTSEYLACEYQTHFFLLPNNGLISLLFEDEEMNQVVRIERSEERLSRSSFLCPIIAHLLNNSSIDILGEPCTDFVQLISQRATVSPNIIRGSVQHIDQYGNLLTNISRELFANQWQKREYSVQARGFRPQQIKRNFSDVDLGDLVIRFNSENILTVAINQGNAHELLGLQINDVVQIRFED